MVGEAPTTAPGAGALPSPNRHCSKVFGNPRPLRYPTPMKTIPIEQVDAVWERMSEVTEAEARRLAQRTQDQQPYIMIYLLAMDENIMDEKDRGRLMELGAIIMEIMHAANPNLRQVTDKDLEAAEAANTRFLEEADEGSEMDYTSLVEGMVANYNQMPLLGAVIEALMCEHEENPELAPDNVGAALLHLKTVIDCLDQ